ncbi:MAG: four helix bundle protein [Anaerolineales bacterium]|nr:four helix bundle protein [Anaerolineales bacterium]
MAYKFEQLDVWKLSLEYIDSIYVLAAQSPKTEEHNLKSQIVRAATSISLNIAEDSTGQSDAEQARFLGFAIRSLIETVACQHIIQRRGYIRDESLLKKVYEDSQVLAKKLQAFRKTVRQYQVRENTPTYGDEDLI